MQRVLPRLREGGRAAAELWKETEASVYRRSGRSEPGRSARSRWLEEASEDIGREAGARDRPARMTCRARESAKALPESSCGEDGQPVPLGRRTAGRRLGA